MLHREVAANSQAPCAELPTRDELILRQMPQVNLIAKQVKERLPISVSLDDLVSAGVLGLIAAIDRFDPNQHVKLKTYAEYKIRGAILDSLRTMDWAPRLQRRRGRLIETAMASLEQRLNRVPSQEEIAQELGVTVQCYQDWVSAARNLTVSSLDAIHAEEEGRNLLRYLSDSSGQSPVEQMEQAEMKQILARTIEKLPKLEKTILSLYYFEEMTLKEISRIIGLHESRISQLKTQSIARLRYALMR